MRRRISLITIAAVSTFLAACTSAPRKTVPDEVALPIAKKHNCLACHGIDKKIVGPSFNQVAARYRNQDVQQQFFVRLRKGGSGVWGPIPEPPHMGISDGDLKLLIRWVTELDGPY